MPRYIRNLHTQYATDGWGEESVLWHYEEMLRVAGFTYDSDDGDPGWASVSNILVDETGAVPANGFVVDPAEPGIITDPLARFTQAMVDDENAIFLGVNEGNHPTADQNAGAWRIMELISASKIRIDIAGLPALGWALETGIPGRILDFDGLRLGNGAWILLNAPAPSTMQVRLIRTASNNCDITIRPSGQPVTNTGPAGMDIAFAAGTCTLTDASGPFKPQHVGRSITIAGSGAGNNGVFTVASWISPLQVTYVNGGGATENPFPGTYTIAGDSTEVLVKDIGYVNTDRTRMNMVTTGPSGGDVLFYDLGNDGRTNVHVLGTLAGAETEDGDPNILWGSDDVSGTSGFGNAWGYDGHMLDNALGQITAWPTYLKIGNADDLFQFNARTGRRLVNGFAFLRNPWMFMENVATGAYVRGRLPIVGFCWTGFGKTVPLDGAGAWMHLANGLAVPRNGPNDPLPLSGKTGV